MSKHIRRRSWFHSSSLLNMFTSSAPSSPEFRPNDTPCDIEGKHCHKPSFTSFLSKKRKQHSEDSSSCGSRRNSEQFSIFTEIIPTTNHPPLKFFKSDEDEADRLQLKNDLVKLAFDGEFTLPFDYNDMTDCSVLDVGCGPGSWCIDLAIKYPHIEVVGIDSDHMFPCNLPSNCQLLVHNVLNGFDEFPDASFDVIHIRFMVLSLTLQQYPDVVHECWRLLKPGGYIEILETDLTVHSAGPVTNKLNEELLDVAISKGLNPRKQAESLQALVPKAAVHKQIKYRSIPIGVWGGRIGVLCRDDMINMLTKFQPTMDDQDIILKEMDRYKSFSNYYFFTAQKPT